MEENRIEPPTPAAPATKSEPTAADSAVELLDRAFKAAVIGLMVWPMEFYAFGLLSKAFLDDKGNNISAQREKAIKTLIMSLPLVLLQMFLLWTIVTSLLDFF
jgi:hypothetical protein